MLIGGYSFILNDGVSDLTDNSIPNQLDDSSKNNGSLDNNTKISNDNSDIKVIKDILGNDLNVITSSFNSNQLNVTEDSDVPAQIFVFSGNIAYLAFPGKDPLNSIHYNQLNEVNKSEYVLSPNYDKNIFIKIGQDFTDLLVQCADGDFIPLGNITHPLPQKGICDLSCGAGESYFDLNSPYVDYRNYDDVMYYIEHGEYPTNDQIDDASPIYSGEPVSGGDYAYESNDVNSINEELPQENAAAENPQIEICPINVG